MKVAPHFILLSQPIYFSISYTIFSIYADMLSNFCKSQSQSQIIFSLLKKNQLVWVSQKKLIRGSVGIYKMIDWKGILVEKQEHFVEEGQVIVLSFDRWKSSFELSVQKESLSDNLSTLQHIVQFDIGWSIKTMQIMKTWS